MDQQTKELIENNINKNDVCLFMKGTPDGPREGIKKFSEWPTVPQLYVKKEFVGGCDIIKEMFENGELKKLFEDKQIKYKK